MSLPSPQNLSDSSMLFSGSFFSSVLGIFSYFQHLLSASFVPDSVLEASRVLAHLILATNLETILELFQLILHFTSNMSHREAKRLAQGLTTRKKWSWASDQKFDFGAWSREDSCPSAHCLITPACHPCVRGEVNRKSNFSVATELSGSCLSLDLCSFVWFQERWVWHPRWLSVTPTSSHQPCLCGLSIPIKSVFLADLASGRF